MMEPQRGTWIISGGKISNGNACHYWRLANERSERSEINFSFSVRMEYIKFPRFVGDFFIEKIQSKTLFGRIETVTSSVV